MQDLYIGVEQEFSSYEGGSLGSAHDFFCDIRDREDLHYKVRDSDGEISNTAIRTSSGLGFYIDGDELETVTPPVRINKGFASRLTDLVMIGRDKIVEATPEYKHTIYSMHWNLSMYEEEKFMEGMIIPFGLFGLTPLSMGMRVRLKNYGDGPNYRTEVLGDTVQSEDQVKATALLLGSYLCAYKNEPDIPFHLPKYKSQLYYSDHSRIDNACYNGRSTRHRISVSEPHSREESLTAQQCMEIFYHWVQPYVRALGTDDEVANLEGFICGGKLLEMDKLKYYAHIKLNDLKSDGHYRPLVFDYPDFPGTTLRSSGKKRELPTEGQLLGSLLRVADVKNLQWAKASLEVHKTRQEYSAQGISQIYELAQTLSPDIPQLAHTPFFDEVHSPKPLPLSVKNTEYNESQDLFPYEKLIGPSPSVKKLVKENISSDSLLTRVIVGGIIGICAGIASAWLLSSIKSDHYLSELVKDYGAQKTQIVNTNTPLTVQIGEKQNGR